MSEIAPPTQRYVGDGVYAGFDGYHLTIAVNDHRNHAVSLEPAVLKALIEYALNVNQHYGVEHFIIPGNT
jgi:hypothetical protein